MRNFPFSLEILSILLIEFVLADKINIGQTSENKVKLIVKYKNRYGKFSQTPISVSSETGGSSGLIDMITSSVKEVSSKRKIAQIQVSTGDANKVYDELLADDDVEEFEEDFPMLALPHLRTESDHSIHRSLDGAETNDRSLAESEQYGIGLVQTPEVWTAASGRSSEKIKVCVVDTGYAYGHKDLPDARITTTKTDFGNALRDGDGHGTHCAGVIGAIGDNYLGVVGVMPDPDFFSFHISKSISDDRIGSSSTVIEGIEGCIEEGAKVISLSLGGGPKSNIAATLFREAYDEGILIFAAAGNDGSPDYEYPASYPHVISVGAVNKDENVASFSNRNDQVELVGPGVNIKSTYPGDKYATLSGTSMSAPHVAGVAALVWSYFPECSNHQIRNILALTAKDIFSSGCDDKSGFGLVQAKAAYDMLDQYGCSAGGANPSPLSSGGIGGCGQILPEVTPNPTIEPPALSPTNKPSTTSTTRPTSSPSNEAIETRDPTQGIGNCEMFQLDIVTDIHAHETLWELEREEDEDTILVWSGPPAGDSYRDSTNYSRAAYGCLSPGVYQFTIHDSYGDGIVPPGYYIIFLDGTVIAGSSNFGREEVTQFIIGETALPHNWVDVLDEDFESGFGFFNDGGSDVAYFSSLMSRNGIVRIQDGNLDQSSVYSDEIILETTYSKFRAVFSFYANNMNAGDSFCLDYSVSNGLIWREEKCWISGNDFVSYAWYDDVNLEFEVKEKGNSLRIRYRCDAQTHRNDILIDRIKLQALQ